MQNRSEHSDASERRAVQPVVSRSELAQFDTTDAGRRLKRLEADTALMLQLSVDGFEGRAWRKVSDALVEYGWQVMRSWIVTGQVFVKLRERQIPCKPAPSAGIPRDDALDLAVDTVAQALIHFRDNVLIPGNWNPAKGANLTTYFISCGQPRVRRASHKLGAGGTRRRCDVCHEMRGCVV